MRSASMGTGDYLCITVRGGAPWGFTLRQGNELHHPLLVSQVTSGGRGALAGLCEGDEVVSLNGEPCADLTLPQSLDIMDASAESLQLLIKRCGVPQNHGLDSEGAYCGEVEPAEGALESTTLEIWPSCGSPTQEELYISESQDEAYYGETESDTDLPRGARSTLETSFRGRPLGNPRPGAVVELQLSLADHSLEEASPGVGGGALMVAVSPRRDSSQDLDSGGSKTELTESLYITQADRKLLSQRSDLVTSSSSSLGQVEVTLQRPGRGCVGKEEEEEEEAEGKEGGSSGCVDPREEGGITEAPPARVSFGISAEGAEPAEEWDSETERDLGRPNKHRARHARLRRSESQSEKQVKEAKSKCKRIALLLTAAPNPNNKGVLMFKKHRQRAKKYTLVSYGTGETEPEDEDEDEEYELGKEDQAVEFTLLATSESELDEELLVNAQRQGDIVTYDWDTGLLEVEKKLDSQREMDRLPETKGKGALMFAKRRQRIDEITAQHEEMRKKGIPVEGVPETETETVTVTESHQVEERSYMQSAENHTSQPYIDVNMQQHQLQQYQDHQQQQYIQQQQQQIQQHPPSMNGAMNDMPRSLVPNRTAKPFSGVQNRVPAPFSPTRSVSSSVSPGYTENKFRVVPPPVPVNTRSQVWSPTGELIASRDERISVPAIKTGILQDTRKRGTTKSALPSNAPNTQVAKKGDKKAGFESGAEEDYLSLGAEACNFLQTPIVKSKHPPPVAPKPTINPASPPWANQSTNQVPPLAPGLVMPPQSQSPQQHPAVSPWTPPQAQPQPPVNTWAPAPPQAKPQPPVNTQAPALPQAHPQPPMNTWGPAPPQAHPQPPMNTWGPAPPQAQPQPPMNTWGPAPPQAHPQPPMNTWGPAPPQAQPQPPMNTWGPAPPQAQPQPPMNTWTPQSQQAPVSTTAPTQTHAASRQPVKSWNQPQAAANSMVSRPMNSYSHASKISSAMAVGEVYSAEGSDKPALKGRGAELFARRQARMEKFVVDAETVQANKVKSSSPTPSLPSSWKYSPNVRAPPPLSYNPILSPFYPPAATKQPPPTSPKTKAKSKAKAPPPPKHLNVLDVMKHQPYQLDPSLFTYGSTLETKSPSPKPAPTPDSGLAYSSSPVPTPTPSQGVSQVKATGPVSAPYPFARQEPQSPAMHDGYISQAPANPHPQPPSAYALPSFQLPPKAESVTGVPSAPRPKFSARKSAVATKVWKPVVMGQ